MAIAPLSPLGIAVFAVPLYAGPALAGLSSANLESLTLFAVFFLFYVVATRGLKLSSASDWAGFVFTTLIQFALVSLCYYIGTALSLVIGPQPIPLWLPITMTGLASVYGAWRYRNLSQIDASVSDALDRLQNDQED